MASQNSVEMGCEQEGCEEKALSGSRVPEAMRKSPNWRLDGIKGVERKEKFEEKDFTSCYW